MRLGNLIASNSKKPRRKSMSDKPKGDNMPDREEEPGQPCFYCGEPTTTHRLFGGSELPVHPNCPEVKEGGNVPSLLNKPV
jgi:hypothetical protein